MTIFVPARDANIPAWQTKVSLAINQLASDATNNTRILPVVIGEPPALMSDGAGNLIWAPIE